MTHIFWALRVLKASLKKFMLPFLRLFKIRHKWWMEVVYNNILTFLLERRGEGRDKLGDEVISFAQGLHTMIYMINTYIDSFKISKKHRLTNMPPEKHVSIERIIVGHSLGLPFFIIILCCFLSKNRYN